MYLEHFKLERYPFSLNLDDDYFFDGIACKASLAALDYCLATGDCFAKVTGEPGTGKTLLCRRLLKMLDKRYKPVHLCGSRLGTLPLLQALAGGLGISLRKTIASHELLERVRKRLVMLNGRGKKAVLFLDEAQALPDSDLEVLRHLSDLSNDTGRDTLLQIVLVGLPLLNERLNQEDMRQLGQRIIHSCCLHPLGTEELSHYLNFRLDAAGYQAESLFMPQAIKQIARASEGVPRMVNILAHKSMLVAFGRGDVLVESAHVRKAVEDTDGVSSTTTNSKSRSSLVSQKSRAQTGSGTSRGKVTLVNQMLQDLNDRQPSSRHGAWSNETEHSLNATGVFHREARRPSPGRFAYATVSVLVASALPGSMANVQPEQALVMPAPEGLQLQRDLSMSVPELDRDSEANTVAVQRLLPRYIQPLTQHNQSSVLAPLESDVETDGKTHSPANTEQPPLSAQPAGTTHIEITQRPRSHDRQLLGDYNDAVKMYEQGDHASAERLLKEVLRKDPSQHPARLLLVRMYMKQARTELAARLLHEGLQDFPQHAASASLYALILASRGEHQEAIDTLEKAQPGAGGDGEFHALLGLLYQRAGKSSASIRSYLFALKRDPTRGEWWVGLGIASEQSGDVDSAASAYSESLQHRLSDEVKAYAVSRRRQLPSSVKLSTADGGLNRAASW